MVAQKLVYDQGIDSPWTIASLSDEDITVIWDVIRRPGSLVGSKVPHRVNHISFLEVKNLKLTSFMFKPMEHCSRTCNIRAHLC